MPPRLTFARKVVCAALLVAVADLLFYGQEPGWTLGAFALAWTAGLCATVPAMRRRPSATVLLLAAGLGLVLVDDPNPLAWLLFWTALASAALLPRHRFDDALRWGVRLLLHALVGLVAPVRDLLRVQRRRSPSRTGLGSLAALLALPLIGGALFLALFAAANPLIEHAIAAIEVPNVWRALAHVIFWCLVLLAVWPSLRPRLPLLPPGIAADTAFAEVPKANLTLSLVTFNAIFALQNASDIAFLWSGARLPAGMTMTEYVHRGAYPLIATALLAGLFVLVALRPGSSTAANATIRRLVILWVGQNIALVASSVLRTLRYIEESMLTEWRIAALAWMALVALGLALILWRLLAGRSAAWLINRNAAAAGFVLLAASAIDLGAIAATWNVRHMRQEDRADLCYLRSLGASALLPLIELERDAATPALRDRATYLGTGLLKDLRTQQADWHSWTWRGARRLALAEARIGPRPRLPLPAPYGRDCQGTIAPPPAPLTNGTQP